MSFFSIIHIITISQKSVFFAETSENFKISNSWTDSFFAIFKLDTCKSLTLRKFENNPFDAISHGH